MDEHADARAFLETRYADGSEIIGLAWSTIYSFARIASSRRIMGDRAASPAAAWATALAFLDQDSARLIQGGERHASIASELMQTPGNSSNDVPDVQLAALAIEHGLTLCTHDHGFARFGRLKWMDPLS